MFLSAAELGQYSAQLVLQFHGHFRRLIPFFVEMSEKHSPFKDLKVESCELSCDGVSQLLSALSTLAGPLNSLSIGGNDLGRLVWLM